MKHAIHVAALLCWAFAANLVGCIVPAGPSPCVRSPCGSGMPSCVAPRFSEPQVPIYSTDGDLQLMPHSQFKIWDTRTPLGEVPQRGFK